MSTVVESGVVESVDVYNNGCIEPVGQVASNILRRGGGGWIKILQTISPIKNSTLISIQVPSSLKDGFLNNDSN